MGLIFLGLFFWQHSSQIKASLKVMGVIEVIVPILEDIQYPSQQPVTSG